MHRWPALLFLVACGPNADPVTDTVDDSDGEPTVDLVSRCDELGLPTRAMNTTGPFGLVENSLADDFTVQTLDGPWTLSENWTGCDGYIFVNYHPDESYSQLLAASDVEDLLAEMPRNIHLFFMSYDEGNEEADAKMWRKLFKGPVRRLEDEEEASWEGRLHYVTESAWTAGWIGDSLQNFAAFHFGIDALQRVREISSIGDQYDGWSPELRALGFEGRSWNYELSLQDRLDKEPDVTLVPVLTAEDVGGGIFEVPLPADMSAFDTMDVDLRWTCGNTLDRTCGEWDYTSRIYVCDEPANPNTSASTPCQPHLLEVMGSCFGDGVDTGIGCRTMDTCAADVAAADTGAEPGDAYTCEGYQAELPADTLPASCVQPDGMMDDSRQQVCNADGTGFDDVNCPCDTEMGRWITSYSDGGRWVTDLSPSLAFLNGGGPKRLSMAFGYPYLTDLTLRLSDQGKGGVPVEAHPLWTGGGFNLSYNQSKLPIVVAIPADAQRVELFALLSGHGWGADRENCAEFCNHQHHVTVGGETFVRDHPVAGSSEGCIEQLEDGTTPNQGGTWRTGRGGWCPGKDVTPWIVDVTNHVTPGQTATISYEALFDGAPYDPVASGSGQGFGAQIELRSWLVISK